MSKLLNSVVLLTAILAIKSSQLVTGYYARQTQNLADSESKVRRHAWMLFCNTNLHHVLHFQDETKTETENTNPFHETETDAKVAKPDKEQFFSVVGHFDSHFLSLLIDFVEQYRMVLVAPLEAESKEKSLAALTSFTREILVEYLCAVKECLHSERNVDKLTEELKAFYDGLQRPNSLVPGAKLLDRGTEMIESVIRSAMSREFVALHQRQLSFLVEYLCSEYDVSVVIASAEAFNATSNSYHLKKVISQLKQLGVSCLNRLVPLTTNQSPLITQLDLNFDDQLWSYTANTFKVFQELIPIELRQDNLSEGVDAR